MHIIAFKLRAYSNTSINVNVVLENVWFNYKSYTQKIHLLHMRSMMKTNLLYIIIKSLSLSFVTKVTHLLISIKAITELRSYVMGLLSVYFNAPAWMLK